MKNNKSSSTIIDLNTRSMLSLTKNNKKIDVSGSLNSNLNTGAHIADIEKFHASQGHGFAAEQANDLIDLLHGKDATIVGGDNAKDGADRLVDGQLIQTKYCQTASDSIKAGFDGKEYRYYDADGKAMQIEVPKDQYDEAVKEMAKRIEAGQVKGYSDPKDAVKLVRKGNITYRQAVNVAKAGTVESITFDAVHSTVIGLSAFGISTVVTYAKAVWDGKPADVALETSLCAGLKMGGIAFCSSLLAAQITRSGINASLKTGTDFFVKKALSTDGRRILVDVLDSGANIYGQSGSAALQASKNAGAQVTRRASSLLRNNIITAAVLIVVASSSDIKKCFEGKISGKQLFKNMMTLAGGMAGGLAGGKVGSITGAAVGEFIGLITPIPGGTAAGAAIGAKIGFWVGGFAGGAVGGSQTNKQLSNFVEDDAIKMVQILEKSFEKIAEEYLLTQEEIDIATDDLKQELDQYQLLEMFASKNRNEYADNLVTGVVLKLIGYRTKVRLPYQEEYFDALKRLSDRAEQGKELINSREIDVVAMGKTLTGKELEKREARKAWYVTKQFNNISLNAESALNKIKQDEAHREVREFGLDNELAQAKQKIKTLLEE